MSAPANGANGVRAARAPSREDVAERLREASERLRAASARMRAVRDGSRDLVLARAAKRPSNTAAA